MSGAHRRLIARGGSVAALMLTTLACVPPPDVGEALWIEIPVGLSVDAVAESLAARGVVTSAERFARFARFGRRHLGIKPGTYPLRPGTSQGRILSMLRRGYPPVRKIEVRERMTLAEVAVVVESVLGIAAEDFIAAARDSGLRARVSARAATIEGYLYPMTYYVTVGATAPEVLRQMTEAFEERWSPVWTARGEELGLTRDEIVILASIIAGEMPQPDERFRVASVYHNRLSREMRLQADPTVVYALGKRRRLRFIDYRIASQYNTYTIGGLPPGPIGQPSAASLEAALFPESTDFLYMVARRDGWHEFSRTYSEHLRSIRRVRR